MLNHQKPAALNSNIVQSLKTTQTQPFQIVLDEKVSGQRKSSEPFVSSSEQCDSLGPNTERLLLGSLLTPEEESAIGDISGETEINGTIGFQDQPLRRKDIGAKPQLEPVTEQKSEQMMSQSGQSQSDSRSKSILSNVTSDKASDQPTQTKFETNNIRVNEGSSEANESSLTRIECLHIQNKQRASSVHEMAPKNTNAPKRQNFVQAAVAAFRNRKSKPQQPPQTKVETTVELKPTERRSRFLPFFRKKQAQLIKNTATTIKQSEDPFEIQIKDAYDQLPEILKDEEQKEDCTMPFKKAMQDKRQSKNIDDNSDCSFQFEEQIAFDFQQEAISSQSFNNTNLQVNRAHSNPQPIEQINGTFMSSSDRSSSQSSNIQTDERKLSCDECTSGIKNQQRSSDNSYDLNVLGVENYQQDLGRFSYMSALQAPSKKIFEHQSPFEKAVNSEIEGDPYLRLSQNQTDTTQRPSSLFCKSSSSQKSQNYETSGGAKSVQNPFINSQGTDQVIHHQQQFTSGYQQQFGNQMVKKLDNNVQNQLNSNSSYFEPHQLMQSQVGQYYTTNQVFQTPQVQYQQMYSSGRGFVNEKIQTHSLHDEYFNPFNQNQTQTATVFYQNVAPQSLNLSVIKQQERNTLQSNPFGQEINELKNSFFLQQKTSQHQGDLVFNSDSAKQNESRKSNDSTQKKQLRSSLSANSGYSGSQHEPTQLAIDKIKHQIEINPELKIDLVFGIASECCKDQTLSRWIQTKLANSADIKLIVTFYEEICSDELIILEQKQTSTKSLMRDVFGNYVIQKMLESAVSLTQQQADQLNPKNQLFELLQTVIIPQVNALSLDPYGCRVLQKALERLPTQMTSNLVLKLHDHCQRLIFDQNGNHVIQKCIQIVAKEELKFILDQCVGRVCELSLDVNGCRIMQRLLERFSSEEIRFILQEIISNLKELRTDVYGNYVVSHVLEFGCLADRRRIVEEILDDLVELSMHKFGSNVVEKCLMHAPEDLQSEVVDRLVSVPISNHSFTIADMMMSKYGNFVVQRVFQIAQKDRQDILLYKIDLMLKQGKINPKRAPAKHIFNFLENKLNMKFDFNLYPQAINSWNEEQPQKATSQSSCNKQQKSSTSSNGTKANGQKKKQTEQKSLPIQTFSDFQPYRNH